MNRPRTGKASSSQNPNITHRPIIISDVVSDDMLMGLTYADTRKFSFAGLEARCKILKVYDGDTITVGFYLKGQQIRISCRCLGYDCAEIKSKSADLKAKARESTKYVSDLLLGKIILVKFGKSDKYGRPLIEILLNTGETLCNAMTRTGLGRVYLGKGLKPWNDNIGSSH